MTKFQAFLFAILILFSQPAYAGINGLNDPQLEVTPPTTPADLLALIGCQNYSLIIDDANSVEWIVQNCVGSSYTLQQFWPPTAASLTGLSAINTSALTNDAGFVNAAAAASAAPVQSVNGLTGAVSLSIPAAQVNSDWSAASGLAQILHKPTAVSAFTNDAGYLTSSALTPYLLSATAASTYATQTALSSGLAGKFNTPVGTSSQYLDGTGAPQNFSTPTPTISHPSRSLNTCFSPSASLATSFVYSVDISAGILSLGGGTGTITQYNDSACSTGAQVIANGAVSSVALSGTSSIPLVSAAPAGKYLKITATATGGASAAIDSVTTEKQ